MSSLRAQDVAELSEAVRALQAAEAPRSRRGAERAEWLERLAWYQRPRPVPTFLRARQRPLRRAALATRHRSRQVRL